MTPPIQRAVSGRAMAFAALCAGCAAIALSYAMLRGGAPAAPPPTASDPAAIAAVASRPHLLFRSTALDAAYGQLALVPLDALDGPRAFTKLSCERVHFAAGIGVCLAAARGMVTSYRMDLFDATYQARHTVALAGMPSRARVSPDGARAALTYFVTGDSYAATSFSTRTFLIDRANANAMANLEDFAISRDGGRFKAADFNFWGVTFAEAPAKFYATLASGGEMYLVEGDAAARTARVLRAGVECPSLSPDNRRIAFKRRMPGLGLHWRIHVLDLATGEETPLSESRSVDDQVEWLDAATVLYALPAAATATAATNVWAASADGSGSPRLVLTNADSPAVVRLPR